MKMWLLFWQLLPLGSAVQVSEEAHFLQDPNHLASEQNGFTLTSVFRVGTPADTHQSQSDAPTLIEHRVPTTTSSSRRLQSVSFADERSRVRTFANMNRVIYPPTDYSQYLDKLGEVFAAGKNFFGTGESAAERAASETALTSAWHAAMQSAAGVGTPAYADKFEPSPTSGEATTSGLGVAAAVYQSATDAVIVFRGSHTGADFNNMFLWFEGWFAEKLQAQMMQNWVDGTGEALTPEMQERAKLPSLKEKAAFYAATQGLLVKQDLDTTIYLFCFIRN
eukprot:g14260.t1